MRYSSIEILMGAVVLVTAIFFLILGMQSIDKNQTDGYNIYLIFGSSAGLKNGDDVKVQKLDNMPAVRDILVRRRGNAEEFPKSEFVFPNNIRAS